MIVFLTREKPAIQRLCSLLPYKSEIFTDFLAMEDFASENAEEIALIALDYLFFGKADFDFYSAMPKDFAVPFVFYNDPFAKKDERALFWLIKARHAEKSFPKRFEDKLWPYLISLQAALNNTEVMPYIQLINPPREAGENTFNLEELSDTGDISEKKMRLLEYLYAKRNEKVSEEDLCFFLWNEYNQSRVNTLYSYISVLRSVLEKRKNLGCCLIRAGKKQYMLKTIFCGKKEPHTLSARAFLSSPAEYEVSF